MVVIYDCIYGNLVHIDLFSFSALVHGISDRDFE